MKAKLVGKVLKGSTIVGYRFNMDGVERTLSLPDAVDMVKQVGCSNVGIYTRGNKEYLTGDGINIREDIEDVELSWEECRFLKKNMSRVY